MLVHRQCGCQVFLNLGATFKFIAAFGITSRGLKTNLCEVVQVGSGGVSQFFCPECQSDVELNNIMVRCMQGGELVELADAVRSESSGGMYCREHGAEFYGDCQKLNVKTFSVSRPR